MILIVLFFLISVECLPLVPLDLDEIASNIDNAKSNKLNLSKEAGKGAIPHNLWIAFREVPPKRSMPKNIRHIIEIAKVECWAVNLIDGDLAEDTFMKTYFANSSIYWAYNLISPAAIVSKVDIWRYCVLYLFGGFYLDDDSSMKSLNKVFLNF